MAFSNTYLVKKLTLCLIKSYKNCRSYYLKNLKVELYLAHIYFSTELLFKKCSDLLTDLDCLSENVSISNVKDHQCLRKEK